jgi:hypothetical protein
VILSDKIWLSTNAGIGRGSQFEQPRPVQAVRHAICSFGFSLFAISYKSLLKFSLKLFNTYEAKKKNKKLQRKTLIY